MIHLLFLSGREKNIVNKTVNYSFPPIGGCDEI